MSEDLGVEPIEEKRRPETESPDSKAPFPDESAEDDGGQIGGVGPPDPPAPDFEDQGV